MPGIYTHSYIFRKSVEAFLRSRPKSLAARSVETLFSTPEHFRAGLFGSIGPNIFDYMKLRHKWNGYGSEISFALHDGFCSPYLRHMAEIVSGNSDSRNEWSSMERGYFYGYISHIIADSVLHPYVFYSSGFPGRMTKKEISYSRKMNLRFQYNIDNWFIYKDESRGSTGSVEEMLPSALNRRSYVWPPVKYLILESLRRTDEELLLKYFSGLKGRRIDGGIGKVKNFDRIPGGISLCYRIKRTESEKMIRYIDRLAGNYATYSDFFIRYPMPKRVDEDAMNIHQGRWQYPANQRGYRYESVLHLVKYSIDQVIRLWEMFEPVVWGEDISVIDELKDLNAYTGEKGVFFNEMKIKDPVRLKV